ncbi:disulfide bond formation protein B [Methylobacterium sp. A49B]
MAALHARTLNALGLLGCCAVLLVAFGYQFVLGELPCPLCLLQRAAFAASGLGFALSVRFGPRPSHYGVAILSSLVGIVLASRQVALHIVPGTGGYGSTLLGLHFYTLALIAFVALITVVGLLLLMQDGVRPETQVAHDGGAFGKACLALFVLIVLANAASTAAECGGGLCPDDPARYEALDAWLKR